MNSFIKVTAIAVTIFSLLSCSSKNKFVNQKEARTRKVAFETYIALQSDYGKKRAAIKKYVSELSLEEKLAQVFMINLEKDDNFFPVEWYDFEILNKEGVKEKKRKTLIPAGYIFFGYNVSKNPETIIGFTDSIIEHAANQNSIPPFLSIDVEGGFVNRLRGVAGPLPENERVSAVLTPVKAYELYSSYAKQLSYLGFNLNLAPVAELNTEKNKEFLSGRSYGNFQQVNDFCSSAVSAYENHNVGTVLKHFPGNTNVDPHIGLPKIDMTEDELDQVKNIFQNLIKENPSGILMSHAIVPDFDKDPACLSEFWINEIIRKQLKYNGIIFSDDIFMGALIDNGYSPAKASKMAIDAGINCIMISEKKFGKWLELLRNICLADETFLSKIEESVEKMIEFKISHNLLSCNYEKESDSYIISCRSINQFNFSSADRTDRLNLFNDERKHSEKIYDLYFRSTANDEELRCLFIK